MRSKDRIAPFLDEVRKVWETQLTDMRFGQLMSNLESYAQTKYGRDLFYMEEDELLDLLKEFVNQ